MTILFFVLLFLAAVPLCAPTLTMSGMRAWLRWRDRRRARPPRATARRGRRR